MKNKILRIFLALVVALPMFTSVFAISYDDLLARLDTIAEDINAMKQEYSQILETYPDVISSLSAETKAAAETLADNLMAEDIVSTVETLKEELAASTATDADKVLEAIENLQADATELIENNKDVVEEVKEGYSDLTVEEIKQVVEKATEIIESLGASTDVSGTYNQMITILDEAQDMSEDITVKLEDVIANNLETFDSALSINLVKELWNEIQNKDEEAVIDTLIQALNNVEGGEVLKPDLKELKEMAVALKDKIMEMETLSEQDLLMFSDSQRADIAAKVKEIEKDYVEFAKVIIDNYSQDYMDVVIDKAYNQTVDQMIRYANIALDYFAEYKDTIKSLSVSSIAAKLPQDLVQKAGIMVALGFIDISEYNMSYITTNFETQIDDISQYLAEKLVEYIDYIDVTINDEVTNVYENGTDSETTQNELRDITSSRFTTLSNIKALKNRVDTELLANYEDIRADLNQIMSFIYRMYEENILSSTGATLMKENDDIAKKYECKTNAGYILTNQFFATSDFTAELGIPSANQSVVTYTDVANSKIRTGTELTIEVGSAYGTAMFAVLGDTYADGMIDARDYMMIKNYIMDGTEMIDASLLAADTYRDELIDARDYMAIKNLIMDGTEIEL